MKFAKAFYNGTVGGKPVINPERQDKAEWTVTVREFLLAAREAGAVVTLTAKPVFLSPEGAGELTGVSRDSIIRRTGTGEIGAIMASTHREIPLGAFEACRRSLPR